MKKLLLLVFLISLSSLAFAGAITINFEQYAAYTQITNQYAADNVAFTDALQLVVPSYDYFDYPPHSGSGVIANDPNDPITVNFSRPMHDVSFWYASPGGILVNGVTAGAPVDGSSNLLKVPGAVTSVTISANLGADGVTVDDLSFTPVPESGSLVLLGSGVLGVAGVLRRKIGR